MNTFKKWFRSRAVVPHASPEQPAEAPVSVPQPTAEEIYARQSDEWFAKQVTLDMDKHRKGIRNPPTAESDYDEHRW